LGRQMSGIDGGRRKTKRRHHKKGANRPKTRSKTRRS
jgi:hypothetical protein